MALTFVRQRGIVEPSFTAAVVTLLPGLDLGTGLVSQDQVEVQRAPDSAGAPGTWESIAVLPPLPASGFTFADPRPLTTSRWWYRNRAVKVTSGGVVAVGGAWSSPVPINVRIVDRMLVGQLENTAVSREKLAASAIADLGSLGRFDFILNGDIEDGLAYWNSNTPSSLTVETGSDRYKGAKSLKLAHAAAGTEDMYVADGSQDTTAGDKLLMRVEPGEAITFRAAAKLSAASGLSLGAVIEAYDHNRAIISSESVSLFIWTTETTWTVKEARKVLSSDTYYIALRFLAGGASAGSMWLDEVHAWRNPDTKWLAEKGTILNPGFAFHGDINTGLDSSASDTVELVAGGLSRLRADGTSRRLHQGATSPEHFGTLGATLNSDHSGASTSSTSETDLETYTLPANGLNEDGRGLHVRAWGVLNAAVGLSSRIRLRFGGVQIASLQEVVSGAMRWYMDAYIVRTGSAAQRTHTVIMKGLQQLLNGGTVLDYETPTVDLTAAIIVKLTGQTGNAADSVSVEGWIVESF